MRGKKLSDSEAQLLHALTELTRVVESIVGDFDESEMSGELTKFDDSRHPLSIAVSNCIRCSPKAGWKHIYCTLTDVSGEIGLTAIPAGYDKT